MTPDKQTVYVTLLPILKGACNVCHINRDALYRSFEWLDILRGKCFSEYNRDGGGGGEEARLLRIVCSIMREEEARD